MSRFAIKCVLTHSVTNYHTTGKLKINVTGKFKYPLPQPFYKCRYLIYKLLIFHMNNFLRYPMNKSIFLFYVELKKKIDTYYQY